MLTMDQQERNKAIVRRFGEAVNSRKLDLLDELLAPDFVRHCQATPDVEVRSREDFKRFLQQDWAAVPDSLVTPRFLRAEGDLVAIFAVYAGTQRGPWGPFAPSGKRMELDFGGVFRIQDGKIAECG